MIATQLREYIIEPTLHWLEDEIPYSKEAVELLVMTAAHESKGGKYVKQINGPACGIYQMEPATAHDIHTNFLAYRPELRSLVNDLVSVRGLMDNNAEDLITNLMYSTAMARVHYYRVKEAIPRRRQYTNDSSWYIDLANYAKKYYNTSAGKATAKKYLEDYLDYIGE